jgi:hypothetical protein
MSLWGSTGSGDQKLERASGQPIGEMESVSLSKEGLAERFFEASVTNRHPTTLT